MKKRFTLISLLCAAMLLLTGCRQNAQPEPAARVYTYAASTEIIKPSVMLRENNQFTFTISALSSYLPVGPFSTEGDALHLQTDDGLYNYYFQIENDSLIFDAGRSSEIPSFAALPDSAVFTSSAEAD